MKFARAEGKDLPLLLSWSRNPPPDINPFYLNLGLIQAFDKLRAKEAIPFLVQNLSADISGLREGNIWMKADAVVDARLPALHALVIMGPDASAALISSWDILG